MTIFILGAGVQGTLYGVRLARAGHKVTLVARGKRAEELRAQGAIVENVVTGRRDNLQLPVVEKLAPDTCADLCFVFVRREQIEAALSDLRGALGIARIVFMVNHANGSGALFSALSRSRVVLGFPSAAGSIENGVDFYVDVAEQPTAIERMATDIAAMLRNAGFRVELVTDVDSWLKRHAVFVTAVGGALYLKEGDVGLLSSDKFLVRTFILAVREGWSELDRLGVAPASLALRAIFSWVPLPLAVAYWCRLFNSQRAEFYFARHSRRAIGEMVALAADVRTLMPDHEMPHLQLLYDAIDRSQGGAKAAVKGDSLR